MQGFLERSDMDQMWTTPTTCSRCCGPLASNVPCLSCWAAEDVARDMGISIEEMLAVAREQWQQPDADVPAVERGAVLIGR